MNNVDISPSADRTGVLHVKQAWTVSSPWVWLCDDGVVAHKDCFGLVSVFRKKIQITDISCINKSQGVVKFVVFYVFDWNWQLYLTVIRDIFKSTYLSPADTNIFYQWRDTLEGQWRSAGLSEKQTCPIPISSLCARQVGKCISCSSRRIWQPGKCELHFPWLSARLGLHAALHALCAAATINVVLERHIAQVPSYGPQD